MEVYVIYKDGELYHPRGRKTVYLKLGSAKQVVTTDSKRDVGYKYSDYCKLSKEEMDEAFKESKTHYEIRIFKDSGEIVRF